MSEKLMSRSRLFPLRAGPCFGQAAKLEHNREGASHLPALLQAHHPEPGRPENAQRWVPAHDHKLYAEQ